MSEVAVATAPKPAARIEPPRVIHPRDFKLIEYEYARFSARLPVGVSFQEVLKPEFWVQIVHLLRKNTITNEPDRSGAIIEIRTEDHAFYAELYVRAVQEKGLIVGVLKEPVYFGLDEVRSDRFETRWNVGKRCHEVVRKSDKNVVQTDLPTKEAAKAWIDTTMKVN